ncbi:hypothetical protein WUBG_11782 [Wuchereria bancrofti]|uniref:Uncharacterized protein n=1 Tax=Wuchereria bancrofti TaxID=6293 RepID=J9EPT2_WUCBA|nr:hypothetical protein WUBG_11782 [Wuchereria bancrofti]
MRERKILSQHSYIFEKGQQQPNEMEVEDGNLRSVKKKIDVEGNGEENNLPHVSLPLTYGTHECGDTTSSIGTVG